MVEFDGQFVPVEICSACLAKLEARREVKHIENAEDLTSMHGDDKIGNTWG
jgi:hypothetical protein